VPYALSRKRNPASGIHGAEQDIEKTKEEVETLKVQLEQAKILRKNKEQYDALAGLIMQHPARSETEKYADLETDDPPLRLVEALAWSRRVNWFSILPIQMAFSIATCLLSAGISRNSTTRSTS
jgi:hypothetical protein